MTSNIEIKPFAAAPQRKVFAKENQEDKSILYAAGARLNMRMMIKA